MDKTILRKLSYGLYIVSSKLDNELVGCVVNTVTQITSENPLLMVSLNKNNYTNEIVRKTKKIAIMVLNQDINKEVIGKFGFYSSKDINKFDGVNYELINDLPVLKEGTCGYITGVVENIIDAETHDIFLIRVKDMQTTNSSEPLTYKYYQENMKGVSSKNAPTYVEEKVEVSMAKKYRCLLCGYIYDDAKEEVKFEDLPDDWHCPLCGASKDQFELID